MNAPVLIIKAETLGDAIAKAKRENPSYACGEEYRQANRCEHYRKENRREPRETLTGKTYYIGITKVNIAKDVVLHLVNGIFF